MPASAVLVVALLVQAGAPSLAGITRVDADTPLEVPVALAESAGPPVGAAASVYVLGAKGYTKAREGTNGFTCMVSRERVDTLEPECFDAEGTATVVTVRLFVEARRAAGLAETRIMHRVNDRYRSGP